MVKKWQTLERKQLADYRIFRSWQQTSQSPRTGATHQFFVLESADWVNIIPITPEGNVVMIHQFRHGLDDVTLEIPGGVVDADDPHPLESARRELLEETGYEVDEIIHIGTVSPNPAFMNNWCHSYLALGARYTQPPHFDGAEDIAVEEIPLAQIPDLIRNGRISHALVVVAFYHYQAYLAAQAESQPSITNKGDNHV